MSCLYKKKCVTLKLQQNGLSGEVLRVLQEFWKDRKQSVAMNGERSSLASINAAIPKCSILSPLLFSNVHLSKVLSSYIKLFLDDTSL